VVEELKLRKRGNWWGREVSRGEWSDVRKRSPYLRCGDGPCRRDIKKWGNKRDVY
jgi:hypothetical protein